MNKIVMRAMLAAAAAALLSGCGTFSTDGGVLSFSTSAQEKLQSAFAFGDKDLSHAEMLAAADTLNVPKAAQCLPPFKAYYDKVTTQLGIINSKGVAGVASTAVVATWAADTIKAGVPNDVQLACGAWMQSMDVDVTDVVAVVTKLAK